MYLFYQSLLKRFIKRESLPTSPYKLVRLDVTDKNLWVGPKQVDIGMGATALIKVGIFYVLTYKHLTMAV